MTSSSAYPFFSSRRTLSGGTVWILVLAWLCANAPQAMTLRFVTWTKDARTFSHQERLKEEVASLLSHQKAEPAQLAARPVPPQSTALPVVTEVVLKKIDFHAAPPVRMTPPEAQDGRYRDDQRRPLEAVRAEPPVPPPRGTMN